MSEKENQLKVIQGGKDEITDEDFRIVIEALFGPYKGGIGYNPEWLTILFYFFQHVWFIWQNTIYLNMRIKNYLMPMKY